MMLGKSDCDVESCGTFGDTPKHSRDIQVTMEAICRLHAKLQISKWNLHYGAYHKAKTPGLA